MHGDHDDVIKWKHFPRYWPFVRGIHRSAQRPVTRIFDVFFDLHLNKSWVNNGGAGDFRRYRAHYDIRVMHLAITCTNANPTSIENSLINSHYTHLTIGFKNSLV